jgi:hypothetical protein
MLVMEIAFVPVLVSVAGCEVLLVPTSWVRNVMVDGVRETELVVATPVRVTLWGLFTAPSVKLKTALRVPEAVGVIVTPTTHDAPKASDVPQVLELIA